VKLPKDMGKSKQFIDRILSRKVKPSPGTLGFVQVECPCEFHGNQEYGGWTICPTSLSDKSVVYSFGVGEDLSFDLSLIRRYGLQVFAFDPTPKAIAWVRSRNLPKNLHFIEYGFADFDGVAKFFPPENPRHVSHTILPRERTADLFIEVEVHRLKTITGMLGHGRIDILKMDIEGAEYAVIEDILRTEGVEIQQILVEFHHRFDNVHISETGEALARLNEYGYRVFHISKNGEEYSFIKR
jgi:FkbM family methyltransferase